MDGYGGESVQFDIRKIAKESAIHGKDGQTEKNPRAAFGEDRTQTGELNSVLFADGGGGGYGKIGGTQGRCTCAKKVFYGIGFQGKPNAAAVAAHGVPDV